MKFDDPFLNTLALLAQLESPEYPKDQWDATLAKAVYDFKNDLHICFLIDMQKISYELFF